MYLLDKLSQSCASLGETPPCLAPNLTHPEPQLPQTPDWQLDLSAECAQLGLAALPHLPP